VKRSALILFFLVLSFLSRAQPGDPGGDPDNPVPLPGIAWLLVAGGIYGAKKISEGRNRKHSGD
jgi:hypothetical protein